MPQTRGHITPQAGAAGAFLPEGVSLLAALTRRGAPRWPPLVDGWVNLSPGGLSVHFLGAPHTLAGAVRAQLDLPSPNLVRDPQNGTQLVTLNGNPYQAQVFLNGRRPTWALPPAARDDLAVEANLTPHPKNKFARTTHVACSETGLAHCFEGQPHLLKQRFDNVFNIPDLGSRLRAGSEFIVRRRGSQTFRFDIVQHGVNVGIQFSKSDIQQVAAACKFRVRDDFLIRDDYALIQKLGLAPAIAALGQYPALLRAYLGICYPELPLQRVPGLVDRCSADLASIGAGRERQYDGYRSNLRLPMLIGRTHRSVTDDSLRIIGRVDPSVDLIEVKGPWCGLIPCGRAGRFSGAIPVPPGARLDDFQIRAIDTNAKSRSSWTHISSGHARAKTCCAEQLLTLFARARHNAHGFHLNAKSREQIKRLIETTLLGQALRNKTSALDELSHAARRNSASFLQVILRDIRQEWKSINTSATRGADRTRPFCARWLGLQLRKAANDRSRGIILNTDLTELAISAVLQDLGHYSMTIVAHPARLALWQKRISASKKKSPDGALNIILISSEELCALRRAGNSHSREETRAKIERWSQPEGVVVIDDPSFNAHPWAEAGRRARELRAGMLKILLTPRRGFDYTSAALALAHIKPNALELQRRPALHRAYPPDSSQMVDALLRLARDSSITFFGAGLNIS